MNIFLFVLFILFIIIYNYSNDYLNKTLSIECINQEDIPFKSQKKYIYAHKKFTKVVNFFYHTNIEDLKESTTYKISITFLMCYFDDTEVELLPNSKLLEDEYQWHLAINNTMINSISMKKKTLQDALIFGKKHLRYGTLYTAETTIAKSDIDTCLIPISLIQLDRKVNFNIKIN